MSRPVSLLGWAAVLCLALSPPAASGNSTILAWGTGFCGWTGGVPEPNSGFVAVSGGEGYNLALRSDSTIVAWGLPCDVCDVPEPNEGFVAIAAGLDHCLALRSDSTIVAWGANWFGELNVPAPNEDFVAIAAGGGFSLGLKADGRIVAWGHNEEGECNVPVPNANFVAIAAGGDGGLTYGGQFSLGLKSNRTIVAWGNNDGGQCDIPVPNANFVAISARGVHALGLRADGSVAAWGVNNFGECDVPAPNQDFAAISAGYWHSLGLKYDGSIVGWGFNEGGECNVPAPNENFTAVAAGSFHSLGLVPHVPAACCMSDGSCAIASASECLALGGYPQPGPASCDPSPCQSPAFLAGGVLITHYLPQMTYSTTPPPGGWCGAYPQYAIDDCSEQNARIDVSGGLTSACWYVLAAWSGVKEWCQVQFGIEPYDPTLFAFIDSAPCYPVNGGYESSSEGWPGPAQGTMLVAGPSPWTGNFVPVYWFAGYAYSAGGSGQIRLGPDRYSVPDSTFGEFVACGEIAVRYSIPEANYGALGVNTDGIAVCPTGTLKVCCLAQACQVLTQDACSALGGIWHAEWSTCDSSPCGTADVNRPSHVSGHTLQDPLPNPSSGSVLLQYDLARPGLVRLDVYDLGGRELLTLFAGARGAGRWEAVWDCRSRDGARVPAGVYYVRLRIDSEVQTKRVLVLR
jgi:hypothetical protein